MTGTERASTTPELELVVEFRRPTEVKPAVLPDSTDRQRFEQLLLRYVTEFITALELPLRPRLALREADPSEASYGGLKLLVGGYLCRLSLRSLSTHTESPESLARLMARAVEDNREALVSETLAEIAWSGGPAGGDAPTGVTAMQRLKGLRELLRRGHALSKLPLLLQRSSSSATATPAAGFEEALWAPDLVAVELSLGRGQVEAICAAAKTDPASIAKALGPRLDKLRLGLFNDLGIILPKIQLRRDATLAHNELRLRLNDLLLPPEGAAIGERATQRDPADWVLRRVESAIRRRAELFLTTYCVDNLRASSPHLVEAVCQRTGLTMLLRVMEALLEEGLSVRDVRGICESLLAVNTTTTIDQSKYIVFFAPITDLCPVQEHKPIETLETVDYLNCVRMAMKPYVSRRYAKQMKLSVYLLDPQIEEWLTRIDAATVSQDEYSRLLSAVAQEILWPPSVSDSIPILTTTAVRRKLWELIQREFDRFPVLCYNELSPEMEITPVARISWT